MTWTAHQDPEVEKKIRALEARKLEVQSQIVQLKADVFKIDHDMFAAGATADRVNCLARW